MIYSVIALSLVPMYLILDPLRVRGSPNDCENDKVLHFLGQVPETTLQTDPKVCKSFLLFWNGVENRGLSWNVTFWLLGCQGGIQKKPPQFALKWQLKLKRISFYSNIYRGRQVLKVQILEEEKCQTGSSLESRNFLKIKTANH